MRTERRIMRTGPSVAGGLILVLTMNACGGEGMTEDGAVATDGDFTIAYNVQPPVLDPMATTAVAARDINRNFYEPLVSLDSNSEIKPVLADNFDVSAGGDVITFNLREDVPFHDGSVMEATDVVASLNYWIERSSVGQDFFSDAEVETPAEGVVTVTLPAPMYVGLDLMANQAQLPVIRPAEIVENAPPEGITEHVGTGPYQLTEWRTDQYVQLDRFEDYASPEGDADGTAGVKEAAFETMYFRFVDDPSTRMNGLQTGEYDAAVGIPHDNAMMMEDDENIQLYLVDSVYNYIVFNKQEGPMANTNARQAVLSAIDPEQIQRSAYTDPEFYTTTPGIMPQGSPWLFESSDDHLERRDNQDQEDVEALLSESGYAEETLRILTTREYEDYYNAAVILSDQLNDAGINNELVVTDWATIVQDREDPDAWDIFTGGSNWVGVPSLYPWMSPDWAGWTDDPEMTAAMEGIVNAEDEEDALGAAEDLQQAVDEYLPLIKFGDRSTLTAISTDYEGYSSTPEAGELFYNVRPVQ